MTEKDYRKDFMGAKKNFLTKKGYYSLEKPQKSPFHYLESLTLDDVVFDVHEQKIRKVYYDYNVSSWFKISSTPTTVYNSDGSSTTTSKSSSGNMDNFYSKTPWVYPRSGACEIPDEIKGIFNLSKTYNFYVSPYDYIKDDAKVKLAKSYNSSSALYVGNDDVHVMVKDYYEHDSGEIFRELKWTGIYLKKKDGSKGDLIGYGYHKEGKTLFRFYERKKAPLALILGIGAAIVVGAILLFVL